MARVISFVQGFAMTALLAAMLTGFWAVADATAQSQNPCDDDPYCHDMEGSDLIAFVGSCGAPACNTRVQICCLPEIIVR